MKKVEKNANERKTKTKLKFAAPHSFTYSKGQGGNTRQTQNKKPRARGTTRVVQSMRSTERESARYLSEAMQHAESSNARIKNKREQS